MKPRKNPRQIPDKPHYLEIDIEGRPTNWRVPSSPKTSRIIAFLQSSGVMDAAARAETGDDIVKNLGSDLPALFSCQGAMLGFCWFDTDQDLETPEPRPRADLFAYGESVFEELHEEGWTNAHVQKAFVQLTERVVASFISQKEVSARVDFLEHPPGIRS